ncbi:MAG: hypothetical protein KKF46_03395 [Nanoarchaeota archaeon]|nr:hypothetical protein [Nanoarchaeota archaeon]MBU1321379.1 hypothetical protein [Nanoarchaeota archaeon]MBU1597439.1 hypothetical protein [Nanoarchaeota archaeon]MBU2441355.1 hypothetical protein [Nanoarchaeota archaeon]
MENQEFFISSKNLVYNLSGKTLSNQLDDSKLAAELPSVAYLNLKHEDEIYLPVSLFSNELTPLQLIVKYLKENFDINNKKIALLLNRDPKTTWTIYNNIKDRKPISPEDSSLQIPLSIFKDRKISAFEALVSYLKKLDLNYADIARLIKKDQRTIWTVYSRARKKLGIRKHEK